MRLVVVAYMLRDERNLSDIASISSMLGAECVCVERPGGPPAPKGCRAVDGGGLTAALRGCRVVVLETYGERLVVEGLPCGGCLAVVVGAEDFGVPRGLADELGAEVYQIPVAAEGMSYNVVSSLVMALYELARGCGGRDGPEDAHVPGSEDPPGYDGLRAYE